MFLLFFQHDLIDFHEISNTVAEAAHNVSDVTHTVAYKGLAKR